MANFKQLISVKVEGCAFDDNVFSVDIPIDSFPYKWDDFDDIVYLRCLGAMSRSNVTRESSLPP